MSEEVTITLPVQQARALANAGGLLRGILEELPGPAIYDRGSHPLELALLGVETALVLVGVDSA